MMADGSSVLKFNGAVKRFRERGSSLRSGKSYILAMDKVNLDIHKGEILGLVGESGSGKTTLGLSALRLMDLTSGNVEFEGKDIGKMKKKGMLNFRSKTQMIFQDPFESLNPLLNVFKTVSAPLDIFRKDLSNSQKLDLVSEQLEKSGLYPASDFLFKLPTQLSGGQRQRIGVARATVNGPEFIVADEPVSMLDVSLRADILNLLKDINERDGTTMLFISHDIIATKYVSHRIAVMHLGQIVEIAASKELLENPMHPYTKLLLKSVPDIGVKEIREEVAVEYSQDIKNTGEDACSFSQKCPFVMDKCRTSRPPLVQDSQNHLIACFLY